MIVVLVVIICAALGLRWLIKQGKVDGSIGSMDVTEEN
jgi:hypothetical protein